MQTRDYDDYIYVSSTLGYRKVNDSGNAIDINVSTDGYCNMYADNIAVSYLHSMSDYEINAIHYFELHHERIFENILEFLSKKYNYPKQELGFSHVNILDKNKEESCFTKYTFIDKFGKKVELVLHQDIVQV